MQYDETMTIAMKRGPLQLGLATLLAAAATAIFSFSCQRGGEQTNSSAVTGRSTPTTNASIAAAAADMAGAATRFWDSLTPPQQAQATFAFDDDERLNWAYIPKARKGIPWNQMSPKQRELATAFLKSGL